MSAADWATYVPIVVVAFAALAYGIRETLDLLGKSRSSKLLRAENEDLIRRNSELDTTVNLLRSKLVTLETEVEALRAQVAELSKRDQQAVLAALAEHEKTANRRSGEVVELLTAIRDGLTTGR